MKRLSMVSLLLLWLVPGLLAQSQAVVREVTGKVEIKAAGALAWSPARPGQLLGKGSFISTGFNSTAVLALGSSVLSVKPLTRLQLEELIAREGAVSTSLYLKVGKVSAEVKTGEGLKQDFTVKSPVSTAAVRGTDFEFDGLTVTVVNGQVYFSNNLGQGRLVAGGESSSAADGPPTGGDQEKLGSSGVLPYAGSPGGISGEGTRATIATVTVRW